MTTLPLNVPALAAASGSSSISSSSTKGKESSRSSRRRIGSAGPPVVLGGGVGALGKASELGVQNLDPYATLYNRPMHSPSPTSPMFPFPPPHSPAMASPIMPPVERSNRSPNPSSSPNPPTEYRMASSNNSLSTTASTSSRTLKTPHSSKVDHNPMIASASGSFDSSPTVSMTSQRAKAVMRPKSPTPVRSPVPPVAQGPLPPTPADREGSTKPLALSNRSRPPPLEIKKQNRLSQDWVQIAVPAEAKPKSSSPLLPKDNSVPPAPARNPAIVRLPVAQMVPMKSHLSPDRPSFERTRTAPPLSPMTRDGRPGPQGGRGSLDQLRDTSPSPAPRHTSHSTPPASILNAASSSSAAIWGKESASTSRPQAPPLRTRRSEDVLRPSMDSAPTKKEIKAMQQRALGVASTSTPPPMETERKSSGLSLKKSSGALKALFSRGASGKGKDKAETPAVPRRPSGDELRRPSGDALRRPSRDLLRRPSGDELRRPSMESRASPSPMPNRDSPSNQSRSSYSADRAMYPAPPLLRAASAGAAPMFNRSSEPRQPPLEDLPALPSSSPVSADTPTGGSVGTPLAEALSASSLPYLSAAANRVSMAPPAETQPISSENLASDSLSTSSSSSTTRAPQSPSDFSPIKPSKSLHLLQLPELDLDFDVAFDNFGSTTPATPRRNSPRKSPKYVPKSPSKNNSPMRSNTTRSPKKAPPPAALQRTASEQRRSQSFDGPAGSVPMLDDFWKSASDNGSAFISPSVAKFFASTSSSSSVPMLSQPIMSPEEPSSLLPSAPQHDYSPSLSSQPSSSDHARTPSNASSTNETSSPSPPRTPEQRGLAGLGFGDLSPSTTTSSTTPTPQPVAEQPTIAKKPFAFNEPPSIPLPPVPKTALAPPAVIEQSKEEEKNKSSKPRERVMTLLSKSQVINPDINTSTRVLARDVERLLHAFRYPSQGTTSADRAAMLRNDLLSLMVEVDKRAYDAREEPAYVMLREACFEWADVLLFELRIEQPANERGACLEGLAAVVESSCLSERALSHSPVHRTKFTLTMIKCMTFVMSKLGAKGVFHNTLLFSGRFLAFAFFRIPHVGEQLVTVLQPPKGALMRFTRTIMLGATEPPVKPNYPAHLLPLCFDNSKSYTARLASLAPDFPTDQERDAFLFQPGNWLRRWQSDDSELFPAFYRAYHRQLALYLGPVVQHYESLNRPVPASVLMRAPGYAHLATIFAKKCHSYILGSVNAVTTSSSASHFEATETAGFRGSQKPPVLETANRRLVETISTFANLRVMIPDTAPSGTGRVIECDGTQLWTDMIDIWTKSIISKTSLYAPKGVFSLFDLLDGIVDPPYDAVLPVSGGAITTSLLDVPHLIYVIRMILMEGEHALTLVKVIAFVFTHWEVLTANPEDRKELCLGLLLQKDLFERLLLFWSQSVRSYVLRLVVFRLGHIHTKKGDGQGHQVEIESVRLLQTRLDRIKQRHDELEPKTIEAGELSEEDLAPFTPIQDTFEGAGSGITRSRSTITMVTESPRAGSANKAERLLGLGLGNMNDGASKGEVVDSETGAKKVGKAANWFKKSFGGNKKKKLGDSTPSPTPGSSPALRASPGVPQAGALPAQEQPTPEGLMASPVSSTEFSNDSTSSPTETTSHSVRKAKPPTIMTTAPPDEEQVKKTAKVGGNGKASPNTFAFEFELPTMSPRSDTFDPAPPLPSPTSPRRKSQPPSPRQPPSPHMSRSFSKRASLLPPSTANVLDKIMQEEEKEKKNKQLQLEAERKRKERVQEVGYDKKLHAYAIRMLAELEDAQKEYDEWWSDGGVGRVDCAPPRLTVAWPFHEGEE
ncbi:hypothetical protein CI109_102509 [Kwoniella shandongensis]|uniref:Uncharacterized protein n=1 Tax=Kwoniella shandongensis TaxID=1734106 RepID=A0A5M6C459_9TREE|nr:uncharacterized protein CI109_003173 [Kwoniella shandongensis]KAA5528275.1 hypothetical protein CI109_003173 [Kwoniella shandongensis]